MPVRGRRTETRDKVVLITGASDGIGAACVDVLRARGARLSLSGRSEEKLGRVARDGDLVTAADLALPETPRLLVERTVERFGRIDVVINNAGFGIYWPVVGSPISETRAMFDLNFFAALALVQAAVPYMRQGNGGSIVNVGSIAGKVTLPWMPLYSVSKSALGALTESLRAELRADGIHVMLVCPGYVLTNFHAHSAGLKPPQRVVASKTFAISPERCARDIVRGLEKRARLVVTPSWGWFLIGLHALAPQAVERHLMQMNGSMEGA